jgi:hypothetical protein
VIRVCGVIGPWQLVTLVAALEQAAQDEKQNGNEARPYEDYVVLYETAGVPTLSKKFCKNGGGNLAVEKHRLGL